MIKQVDLVEYLPPFIQEYKEIQRITDAENPEFQMLWDINEQLRNNLYILTADEQGLKRFERILGIYPSTKDTIEARRLKILARWNEQLPYTIQTLKQQLENVCNKDAFFVLVEHNKYTLKIRLINLGNSLYQLVYALLVRIVPSNMIIDLVAEHRLTDGHVYVSARQSAPVYKTVIDGEVSFTCGLEGNINVLPAIGLYRRIIIENL